MVLPRRKLQPSNTGDSIHLKNVNKHNSQVTSAIYICSISNNHPKANTLSLQDNTPRQQNKLQEKQEARKAIHIKINKPALHSNTGQIYILETKHLLEADKTDTNKTQISHKIAIISPFHVNGSPE